MVSINLFLGTGILGVVGISAVCASIFILLRGVDNPAASYKNILFGYGVALIVGVFYHWIINFVDSDAFSFTIPFLFECLCAVSILTVIFIFFTFKLNHPPAIGMTLGLVIEHWVPGSIVVISLSVLGLILFRALLL